MKYVVLAVVPALLLAQHAADEVILNEYNAVGSARWLDEGDGPATPDDPENDPETASEKQDVRLGRVMGNGGNWFEIAVVGDETNGSTVDMRGWKLAWVEGDDAGEIVLSDDSFWQSVLAGTLITIGELESLTAQDGSEVVNGSDTSVDFGSGDQWAHVFAADSHYISSTTTNVDDDQDDMGNPIFGRFSVGNDDWNLTILNSADENIFGPLGEGTGGVDGGVGSREVFKLETDIGANPDVASYNDGETSTLGSPNVWTDNDIQVGQDFSQFGVVPEPSSIGILLIGALALVVGRRR